MEEKNEIVEVKQDDPSKLATLEKARVVCANFAFILGILGFLSMLALGALSTSSFIASYLLIVPFILAIASFVTALVAIGVKDNNARAYRTVSLPFSIFTGLITGAVCFINLIGIIITILFMVLIIAVCLIGFVIFLISVVLFQIIIPIIGVIFSLIYFVFSSLLSVIGATSLLLL